MTQGIFRKADGTPKKLNPGVVIKPKLFAKVNDRYASSTGEFILSFWKVNFDHDFIVNLVGCKCKR